MNGVEFVERLREILQEKNISQNQFLKENGLAKGSMANWEQRGNIPAADIVFKIAKYLNVSMEFLVTGEEGKNGDFDLLETMPVEELKFIDFKTDEDKHDEEILLSNFRILNSNNKKTIQALMQYMILNQD